jgi:hypothetical protein
MPLQFRTNVANEERALACFQATGWELVAKSYSTDQRTVKVRMKLPAKEPVKTNDRVPCATCGSPVFPEQIICERCDRYSMTRFDEGVAR